MRIHAYLLLIGLTMSMAVEAQVHYRDFLPKKPQYHPSGWLFAPGLTYSPSLLGKKQEIISSTGDSTLMAESNGGGRFGWYAELGRYRMTERLYLIRMIDYGVAYKSLAGNEKFENYFNTSDAKLPLGEGKSRFRDHIASAFFNATHTKQVGKYHMIMNTLGLNFDYHFIQSREPAQVLPVEEEFTGPMNLQLHYKFSYAIKLRGNWIVIPQIETPVLNIWSFTNGIPGIKAFSSTYQPFIVSVRFMMMRPNIMKHCPPVDAMPIPEGIDGQQ